MKKFKRKKVKVDVFLGGAEEFLSGSKSCNFESGLVTLDLDKQQKGVSESTSPSVPERFGRKKAFCQPTLNPHLSKVSSGQSNKHRVTSTAL